MLNHVVVSMFFSIIPIYPPKPLCTPVSKTRLHLGAQLAGMSVSIVCVPVLCHEGMKEHLDIHMHIQYIHI